MRAFPARYDRFGGLTVGAMVILSLIVGGVAGLAGTWSLAVLAPAFAVACIAWPALGAALLVVACALDRVAVGVGGPNVRPDELAAILQHIGRPDKGGAAAGQEADSLLLNPLSDEDRSHLVRLLGGRPRSAAGPTAAAHGLYLAAVGYGGERLLDSVTTL